MKILPLIEAKRRLSGLVERVRRLGEEVVITKNGRPVAVLISVGELGSWKETPAIRADPEFAKDIRRGLAALKAGKAKRYTLQELFD